MSITPVNPAVPVSIPVGACAADILAALGQWSDTSTTTQDDEMREGLVRLGLIDETADISEEINQTDTFGMPELARTLVKEVPPHHLADFIDALIEATNPA